MKAVIFDIGGVIAHDVWENLLCEPPGERLSVAVKYNLPIDEVQRVGQDLWTRFDVRTGDPDMLEREYWAMFLEAFKEHPGLKGVTVDELIHMTDHFVRPIHLDETIRIFNWLTERGIPIGICSNNNEFWVRKQLTKLGFEKFVKPGALILSCREGINKGDSRMFEIAARAVGVPPENCIFVDDRMSNVERANGLGMTAVFVPSGDHRGPSYLFRLLQRLIGTDPTA